MSDLDVALTLRLRNLMSGPAGAAQRDLSRIGDAAKRLNGTVAGGALAGSLRQVSGAAAGAAAGLAATQGRLAQFKAAGAETAAQLGVLPVMMGRFGLIAGGAALGVLATAAALKGATQNAIGFETSMAQVKKAVDLTPEQFARLRDTILQTSRATGIAKENIAALVAQAGFMGRPTGDLPRFAAFVAKAAKAFEMSADATALALGKVANIWKLDQEGVEGLADAVKYFADTTGASEAELLDFTQRVADLPKIFGLSKEATLAFGASMIDLGSTPDKAASAFNALIMRLSAAKDQSRDFQKGLKAIGWTAGQVQKSIQGNPLGTLLDMFGRLRNLPKEQQIPVLRLLVGQEFADDLVRILGGLDKLKDAINGVETAKGSVDKTFKIFSETTQGQIDRAAAGFSALGERIGRIFSPAVGAAAGAIADVLDRLLKLGETKPKEPATGRRASPEPDLPPMSEAERGEGMRELGTLLRERDRLKSELADGPGFFKRLFGGAAPDPKQIEQIEERIRVLEGKLGPAAQKAMEGVTEAIRTEGARAAAEAGRVADDIKAKFNFTVSPTISPHLGGGSGGAAPGVPGAPKPQSFRAPSGGSPQREARAGTRSVTVGAIHIHGAADPQAVARAVGRQLARLGDNANALFDRA